MLFPKPLGTMLHKKPPDDFLVVKLCMEVHSHHHSLVDQISLKMSSGHCFSFPPIFYQSWECETINWFFRLNGNAGV